MKGYKGMSKNMTCMNGMQYEVGKTYHADGKIALCINGLHFCERLKDVFRFYERNDHNRHNRYFEVYASGQIVSSGTKSVASELTIIRELTDIEVNRAMYGYGDGNGYGYSYSYGCSGNGYGDGNGYGSDGYSDGNGSGNGDGNGYGYSYSYGCGGNGYGDGDGYGDGNGGGYGNGRNDNHILNILYL